MSESNRRYAQRRDVCMPASLKSIYETDELDARTVNVSRRGVSLEALGRVPLLVRVKGKGSIRVSQRYFGVFRCFSWVI